MTMTIELGNVWELLSAVGTLCATAVALILAKRDTSKRLKILFLWDAIEYYCPIVFLSNIGVIPIAIREIQIFYANKNIYVNSVLNDFHADTYSEYLLKGGETKKIKLDANSFKLQDINKPHCGVANVKVIIEDMGGKKYICRQKLEYSKLEEAIFGAGFFKDFYSD